MADLFANVADGSIVSDTVGTWAGARDDTDGSSVSAGGNNTSNFVQVHRFAGRSGTTFRVGRSFMYFDTSGITGNVSAATIKIYGSNANDCAVIAVKSNAYGGDGGTALATTDLDAIVGYSAGANLAGNATIYGNINSSWNTSAYNSLSGTSDLMADMQNNDIVIVAFLDYSNDYRNNAPGSTVSNNSGAYFANYSGTSRDPVIVYTEDAASGYANDVMGVATANIGKVLGIATGNIGEILGV